MWAKDGTVPEIHWIVNSGNTRRESTQALLIPEMAAAGFNVIADNCDAACFFQQRLPALDYDLAMYINTASPDPEVTSIMACDSVPSEANGNQGQNSTGWCNEEASAIMYEADQTLDEGARADLVHQIAGFLAEDSVMLPLFQFPNIAAWRTDTLSGPIAQDAGNYQAFQNIYAWEKTVATRSSSAPSSGPSASTRSPNAPTRPGTSGRRRSRCSRMPSTRLRKEPMWFLRSLRASPKWSSADQDLLIQV